MTQPKAQHLTQPKPNTQCRHALHMTQPNHNRYQNPNVQALFGYSYYKNNCFLHPSRGNIQPTKCKLEQHCLVCDAVFECEHNATLSCVWCCLCVQTTPLTHQQIQMPVLGMANTTPITQNNAPRHSSRCHHLLELPLKLTEKAEHQLSALKQIHQWG